MNNVAMSYMHCSGVNVSFLPQQNLAKWLEYFNREQFLIIESSELYHYPEATLKTALSFLKLTQIAPDVRTALRDGRNEGCTGYRLSPVSAAILDQY
jgi:hypothetical protein